MKAKIFLASGRELGTVVVALLLFKVLRVAQAIEIDNGIVGEPTISCGTDTISFWVRTQKPFEGKVYVKGEYGKAECTRTIGGNTTGVTEGNNVQTSPVTTVRPDVCPPCPTCASGYPSGYTTQRQTGAFQNLAQSQSQSQGQTYAGRKRKRRQTPAEVENNPLMAHLTVQMGTCNIKRDRSLTPPGVTVSYTVVVSFHPYFITKVDKAYQIRCFYMEADKTVTSAIDVSMPGTTELTAQATMPRCEYTIRRDSPDGAQIRYARVGDMVFHRWECVSEMQNTFGMLVHDCYVDDGQGQRVQVINEKGCSTDHFAIPDLTYKSDLYAWVEAHVFKFADRAVLDFQCAITICVKAGGGCDGVTPPSCTRQKRQIMTETVNTTISAPMLDMSADSNQWNLHAQRLTVVDLDDDIKSDELKHMEQQSQALSDESSSAAAARLGDVQDEKRGKTAYYREILQKYSQRGVCLSVVGFGVLVALCTFVFTVAAVIAGTFYILRRRKEF